MGRVVFPYCTPTSDMVSAGSLILEEGEGLSASVKEHLGDWDPSRLLKFSQKVTLDLPAVYSACCLGAEDRLRMALVWRSDGTALGSTGICVDLGVNSPADTILQLQVPAFCIRTSVTVRTVLVLAVRNSAYNPFAAFRPGSILWQAERRISLDCGAAYFPVEVVNFKNQGLPSEAAWYLDFDTSDWFAPVLGSVRLYLNASNEKLCRAVENAGNPSCEQAIILSALYYDVGKSLIRTSLNSDEFRYYREWPPHSIGRSIAALIRSVFPNTAFDVLNREMNDLPGDFETKVQAGLHFLS
jgi:hypothetical protein